jgi:hypothetical protein
MAGQAESTELLFFFGQSASGSESLRLGEETAIGQNKLSPSGSLRTSNLTHVFGFAVPAIAAYGRDSFHWAVPARLA